MKPTPRHALLAVLSLSMVAGANTFAATLQTSGIAPFDTNLGVLTQVVVTLDPAPAPTSPYQAGLLPIPTHAHVVSPPPVSISGLGTFTFPSNLPTTAADSDPFDSHFHYIDLPPSMNFYSGAA